MLWAGPRWRGSGRGGTRAQLYPDIFLVRPRPDGSEERRSGGPLPLPAPLLVLVVRVEDRVDGLLVIDSSARKGSLGGQDVNLLRRLKEHILSAFLTDNPPDFPFIALVVSGRHTNLYLVRSFLDMQLLGRSRDDAAREAFDKVAKLMGLGYPGGVIIEALAASGDPAASALPRPRTPEEPLTFSFSGLKTAVAVLLKKNPEILAGAAGRA